MQVGTVIANRLDICGNNVVTIHVTINGFHAMNRWSSRVRHWIPLQYGLEEEPRERRKG